MVSRSSGEWTFSLANDVKQRMIERMALLLAAKGVQGASFSEVLEASGAPRGSLYHHFPGGKDQLVIAAMDWAAGRLFGHLDKLEGQSAPDVARGFIAGWRALLSTTPLTAGCSLVAVSLGAESPSLRAHAGALFREWRGRLAQRLLEGGVASERSEALAAALLSACEGAVAIARAEGSMVAFELMASEQVAAIEGAMPHRRKPAGRAADLAASNMQDRAE